MPERGGPSAQSGFLFQNTIAVEYLSKMLLDDQISGVRCEAPEPVDDIVVFKNTEPIIFISVKEILKPSFGSWNNRLKVNVWKAFLDQWKKDPNTEMILITSSTLTDLRELCKKARTSLKQEEFNRRLTKKQQKWYKRLSDFLRLEPSSLMNLGCTR